MAAVKRYSFFKNGFLCSHKCLIKISTSWSHSREFSAFVFFFLEQLLSGHLAIISENN